MVQKLHTDCCRLTFSLAAPERLSPLQALKRALENTETEKVAEVILQSIPYSGFPAAVEALGWLRDLDPDSTIEAREDQSRNVFEEVYGGASEKVADQLQRRHPDLREWILGFAYRTVMGSGPLSSVELEILAVSSLLAQSRMTPFHSHLRGALRCGATRDDLTELLESLEDIAHPDSLSKARELLRKETGSS